MAIDLLDTDKLWLTDWLFSCEILGEPASKANSRKIVKFGKQGQLRSSLTRRGPTRKHLPVNAGF